MAVGKFHTKIFRSTIINQFLVQKIIGTHWSGQKALNKLVFKNITEKKLTDGPPLTTTDAGVHPLRPFNALV
jgi:hypothetical protein